MRTIAIDSIIGKAIAFAVILDLFVKRIVCAATPLLIFLKARARFAQHAKIMVGELQIIFGIDAVALHLRVPRERFILLQQLGRIAACAIIDPVAIVGTPGITPRCALPPTTATAAGLTIIDQVLLSSCPKIKPGGAFPK